MLPAARRMAGHVAAAGQVPVEIPQQAQDLAPRHFLTPLPPHVGQARRVPRGPSTTEPIP